MIAMHPNYPFKHRRTKHQGLAATSSEWADRFKVGGYSVAGIALAVAAGVVIVPWLVRGFLVRKGVRTAKALAGKRKRGKK